MSLLFVAVVILALSNFFVLASHADDMYGSACDDNLEALDKCIHGCDPLKDSDCSKLKCKVYCAYHVGSETCKADVTTKCKASELIKGSLFGSECDDLDCNSSSFKQLGVLVATTCLIFNFIFN
mmetsp:Transcript_9190/g.15651  ORF Transcript_9190/g.15651 Transcript_9190/m.15651 type:complete len:124 (-) Transcript_9190:35-406(-)